MNDNYVCTDTKYNRGVLLNEFKGEYSIVGANEGKDGKIYMDFGEAEVGKDKRKVRLPLAGKLGNRQQAIDVLRTMIIALEEQGQANYEGDVPF